MSKSKFLTAAEGFIMTMIFPGFAALGAEEFRNWLDKIWAENEELMRTSLTSLYPLVDVYLERFAKQSKTKLDDITVAQLKKTLEEFAAEKDIKLPNLDEGTAED